MTTKEEKWFWRMDWCKTNNVPPADTYWWNMAEEEYKAQLKAKNKEIEELKADLQGCVDQQAGENL